MAMRPKPPGSDEPMLGQSEQAQSEQITYIPGPGDPLTVTWRGHKFTAHVPKPINNPEMIEQARGNRHFKVGAFNAATDTYRDEVKEPRTAEAYRAWAVHWLNSVASVDEMCVRWANEAKMRERLEVGHDDFKYLSSLFQPKLDELIRLEDEPRRKRDEIVTRNDLVDLELQVLGVGAGR